MLQHAMEIATVWITSIVPVSDVPDIWQAGYPDIC